MDKEKMKNLSQTIFWCGLGWFISAFIGLDGIREQIYISTMIIGLVSISISVILRIMSNIHKENS